MVERIGIWSLTGGSGMNDGAVPLEEIQNTETEQRLEDLLVASPDLLVRGLRLIGRQLQTEGGPLDLLGVDPDGRVVLFELKRGTLTREAVAQILDYTSDLLERQPEDFASLIQSSSGRLGIPQIEDFSEWFSAEYPDVGEPDLDELRMVLVGLGVDTRAKRIVNLLARSGMDVQLLTFQAFRRGDEVFLARQVETVEPKSRSSTSGSGTKQGNRKILEGLAQDQGVRELLLEVADFVGERMPAYRWPNQSAFTYSLNEVTEAGRPTQRSYGVLWVDKKVKGRVVFSLPTRAIESASEVVQGIVDSIAGARLTSSGWTPFELPITDQTWPEIRPRLGDLVAAVVAGWEQRTAESESADMEKEGVGSEVV